MNCVQCKGYSLDPIELETKLVAAGCSQCEGVLLPLLNYRYWLSTQAKQISQSFELDNVEDTQHALICPKCARLMFKYRIDLDQQNRIDVCASCGEVWLDKGEWQLLKILGLYDKLPDIATDRWQKNLAQQYRKERHELRYKKLLGEANFYRAADFKMWLDEQNNKPDIVNYLSF